jgi:SOS-response transcriptional repressor LexA
MQAKKIIPIMEAGEPREETGGCSGSESYALMVLGDSMEPEFYQGEIIVVEPDGLIRDGSFVIAHHDGEYIFRQLVGREGRWYLKPLNDRYPTVEIPGLQAVKGVVIQKKRPGSRRMRKSYI